MADLNGNLKRTPQNEEEEEGDDFSEQSKRRRVGFSKRKESPLYYHSYLGLDQLLTSQKLMSAEHVTSNNSSDQSSSSSSSSECPMKASTPKCPMDYAKKSDLEATNRCGAHDEHLFIIIHQAFELWFKQILWEIGDAQKLMNNECIPERDVATVIHRFSRVVEILRLLVDQFTILETMTPLGFLEFRDYLFPASGFQSVQWRKLECAMGLEVEARASYGPHGKGSYCAYLTEDHKTELKAAAACTPSLHELVTKWLERTPFCTSSSSSSSSMSDSNGDGEEGLLSSLWDHYKLGVSKMLTEDRKFVVSRYYENSGNNNDNNEISLEESMSLIEKKAEEEGEQSAKDAVKQFGEVKQREASLATILNAEQFEEARQKGEVRFTHKAFTAALLITLYQEEPVLHQASRLLKSIIDIDELMTTWRQRHALMVHRMIGVKMGTGGSSGYHYLQEASMQHRVFKDLFNLSTFLVPRCELPNLPSSLRNKLSFSLETNN